MSSPPSFPIVLPVSAAARRLGVCAKTIRRWDAEDRSVVFVLECVEFKWRKWENMIEGIASIVLTAVASSTQMSTPRGTSLRFNNPVPLLGGQGPSVQVCPNCNQRYCCDCLQYHWSHRELPGCLFPEDAERTYDRSLEYFIKVWSEKLGMI